MRHVWKLQKMHYYSKVLIYYRPKRGTVSTMSLILTNALLRKTYTCILYHSSIVTDWKVRWSITRLSSRLVNAQLEAIGAVWQYVRIGMRRYVIALELNTWLLSSFRYLIHRLMPGHLMKPWRYCLTRALLCKFWPGKLMHTMYQM